MTAASANPVLANLTHPVFPESFTATTKALSPFRIAPIGFKYGLATGSEIQEAGTNRAYHLLEAESC